MNNNKNDNDLLQYKNDFEELQDYCLSLKKIEENIIFQYNNLQNSNLEYFQKSYLIEMKDYNKFKEQIEYNAFINNLQEYRDIIILKLIIQESEGKNSLKEKLKQTIVNSVQELYKLLKKGGEYILIDTDLSKIFVENKDSGIYSYSINNYETILNIKGETLHFENNKNILNLNVLKTKENEIFQNNYNKKLTHPIFSNYEYFNDNENINNDNNLDCYEKLTDWLLKFIITERDFKIQLKPGKIRREKEKYYGYLIEYNTYKNWEKNLYLVQLKVIIQKYISNKKRELTKEEKLEIKNILIKNNISKKIYIESLQFKTIEKLKDFNKINNLILLNKELFLRINDERDKQCKNNEIEYEISDEKSIDIFINKEKCIFMKFENVIYSYLYYNLCLLIKINIFQKYFFSEKKPSVVFILSKELLIKYKNCFMYKNLLPFIEKNNFDKRTDEKEIFDFVEKIPNGLINSIKENVKSFKFEIKFILPKIIKTKNDINFSYIKDFDSIFLSGGLFINFCNIHSLSSEDSKIFRHIIKIFFIKEKLLIMFEHEKEANGQIGNINNSNEQNIFDIDYLISVKENNSKNKGTALLNEVLKTEDDYNKFYQNIYDNNQNDCFEYKISDELILNILNFKRNELNILNKKNRFNANKNKQKEFKKKKNIHNQNDNKNIQNNRNAQSGELNGNININSHLYKGNKFYNNIQKKKNELIIFQNINNHQLHNFQNEKFNRIGPLINVPNYNINLNNFMNKNNPSKGIFIKKNSAQLNNFQNKNNINHQLNNYLHERKNIASSNNSQNNILSQNNKFKGTIDNPIHIYQKYIPYNKNNEDNTNINKEIKESPFMVKNDDYYIHQNNDLMNQLYEEKQKIIKLEKELNLVKQRVKELEDIEEKIIAINFISFDEKINYPMKCKKSDIFSKLEEKLYYEYPDYKRKNLLFISKGKVINRNETLEKNRIKNGDSIFLKY